MNWQTTDTSRVQHPVTESSQSIGAAETLVSISEACAATGLSARTVRYYEELGLLPDVRRRAGGRRVYGPPALERLHFIQRLKTLGLSLSEIKDLNEVYALAGSTQDMLGRLDELLCRHLREVDGRLAELHGLQDELERYRSHVHQRLGRASEG